MDPWSEYLQAAFIGLPQTDLSLLLHQTTNMITGHFFDESEERPSKRYLPSKTYTYLTLTTNKTFYFTEDDGKDVLLPSSTPLFLRKLISTMPHSLRDRLEYLSFFDEASILASDPHPSDSSIENIQEELYEAYLQEMRLRRAFRKVLQLWRRYQTHKRDTHDTDPITLTTPAKPLVLYDLPSRRRYVFDAAPLAQWIESNLRYQEGGFSMPLMPRNPWTNQEFTYVQLISLYEQLKHHGELRWGMTTLREHDFNKSRWQLYHASALTLHAIRSALTLLDSVDAREMLEDFIFSKMEDLHLPCPGSVQRAYRAGMISLPHHWYLEEFKSVAFVHFEADHFGHNKHRIIHNRCDALFRKQPQFFQDLLTHHLISSIP